MATIQNVIKWVSNIEEFRAQQQKGIDQIVAMENAVQKTVRSLGGEGLMRAAHNAAAAVEKLGGVTRLTANEQDRVHTLLDKALAKYQALGQTAPTALQRLYDDTKRVATVTEQMPGKTDQWKNSLIGLGSALGITFSVAAVVGFAKELLATGDSIQKMADKTSLGTVEVQRLDYVASQTGVSLEGMVGAVQNLQQRLGDGDQGAVGALHALGINMEEFLQLKPYEQVMQLAEAISKIADPTKRAAIEADLFGKSWKEIGPAMIANIREMADAASVMSDRTVKTLDASGDALDRFWRMVKSNAANQIGLAILSVENLPKVVNQAFKAIHLDVDGAARDVKDLGVWWDVLIGKIEKPPKVGVSQAVKDMFAGQSVPKIRLSADELAGVENTLNREREALDRATKAADTHRQAIQAIADKYSGAALARQVSDLSEAMRLLPRGTDLRPLADEIGRLFHQGAKLTPEMIQIGIRFDTLLPKVQQGVTDFKGLGVSVDSVTIPVKRFSELMPEVESGIGNLLNELPKLDLGYQFSRAKEPVKDLTSEIHALAQGFTQLAQVSGDAFGGIVQDVANVITAWDLAAQSAKAYGEATTAAGKAAALASGAAAVLQATGSGSTASRTIGGALSGAAIGSAFGPVGTAIGAAAGALTGFLRGIVGLTDYQKRVRAAAVETEALHQNLVKSHGSMARLIIDADLVGINIKEAFKWKDPEAFKNIVSELDQKTQLLNAAMQEYGFTWEDLGEKARGAQLAQLFDDLYAKTDILRTAGIDYHTILERQAGDYSSLVQAAIRTGTEIPAAMQPVLQDLVDMGKLVDANGNAFTDLSDVHWAKTLTQGFDEVTDAIHELTDALVHGVGGALDTLGHRQVRIPIRYDVENPPELPGGESAPTVSTGGYVLPFRTGGMVPEAPIYRALGGDTARIIHFTPKGTDTVPAMLTPGEIVLNAAQQKRVAGAIADQPAGEVHYHVTVQVVGAVDGPSVQRVVESREFHDALEKVIVRNPRGLKTVIRQAAS